MPLTVRQISQRTHIAFDPCRHVVRFLACDGLLHCLNAHARRSRVYWLTTAGETARIQLAKSDNAEHTKEATPDISWELYGWVCYRHRSAILRALSEPLQPAVIKRRARSRDPTLRMSANNVRDVIRLFRARGIVQAVRVRRSAHPRYELTAIGHLLRTVLLQAEVST